MSGSLSDDSKTCMARSPVSAVLTIQVSGPTCDMISSTYENVTRVR